LRHVWARGRLKEGRRDREGIIIIIIIIIKRHVDGRTAAFAGGK
jgi:hypothetical protein